MSSSAPSSFPSQFALTHDSSLQIRIVVCGFAEGDYKLNISYLSPPAPPPTAAAADDVEDEDDAEEKPRAKAKQVEESPL